MLNIYFRNVDMKIITSLLLVLSVGISCSGPSAKKPEVTNTNNFGMVSKNIIDASKSYLASQVKNSKITEDSNGNIDIKGDGISFLIKAADINIGLIDEDNSQDAIVSYIVSPAGGRKYTKQLILLNKGDIKVVRDFISELRVMQISNHTVFGELPKYGPESPLHTCHECKENVKYKLVADSLQLIK